MAENTAIEWCDATFNPWIGCTKISPACDHCYAEALMDTRHGRVDWGGDRVRTSPANWQQPRRWQRQAAAFHAEHGRRRRVFCASLADVFDNQVPAEWRANLWALILVTPDLDWLLLTKRPQNIGKMLPAFWDDVKGHVWLGTTVEDQKRADQNIPHLLEHDAAVRFVSIEPMLGPIDLAKVCLVPQRPGSFRSGIHLNALVGRFYESGMPYFDRWNDDGTPATGATVARIDWVIAGGESGPHARPSNPDWFRSLRNQCATADVPFLFKQWGEWVGGKFHLDLDDYLQFEDLAETRFYPLSRSTPEHHWEEDKVPEGLGSVRLGKRLAGRTLDGATHDAFPVVRHA
ncbi:phage Gp37/Gp68 family protein [Devosia ginsengisoli]|uniref:phage Gp37/Gp68 family protein n=1 Tax=Devosia ginsengisoli TaxID=400770 RepID=UPI0026F0EBE9|nr:phage Gp37/Gp68 family protein [Devosia ginsengisoli]MCR6672179.1 phage Gp37/Gp68 family protein [Devosia ginsengisoli]